MTDMGTAMHKLQRFLRDLAVTLLLWLYFTLGFVAFFLPFYLGAFFLKSSPEGAFQKLNHYFYRSFFQLLRLLMPELTIRIDPALRRLRGAVVVSNHHSYLDPLMFQSTFARQTTIVKSTFFRVPIFGWLIKNAGYMPASAEGPFGDLMLQRMATLRAFFSSGGVMFVFPEGTRRPGRPIGALHEGAFKIARRCQVPLAIVRLRNTERIFTPGQLFFHTTDPVTIEIDLVHRIENAAELSLAELKRTALAAFSAV
ncbi:MAG: 1-acyl-sn-glycerol-3-phosphate acyltransferase [Deltaproteobacteria bacterium]|nr:1-acyl-sn-glycerol-3-phosphate acyltransferase [Deltaproteobacteria bacterium]